MTSTINTNIVNFGSLPYGTAFESAGIKYKKNVYPGITTSDFGYGSALDPDDNIVMFNNMTMVENLYVERD